MKEFLNSKESQTGSSQFPDHTAEKILRYGSPVGSVIECHDRIPRCMERLKELIDTAEENETTLPSGSVVLAYELENGSGRFERTWHAPRGGLWLAVAWADTLLPEYTRLLPLAAGTASCEAVRNYGIDAAIKWVNDIHVCGRKLGGILCETYSAKNSGDRYHLIGIGINCNVEKFPGELQESAVSMHGILGHAVDLERFSQVLLSRLVWNFGLVHLQEEEDLENLQGDSSIGMKQSLIVDAWLKLSDTVGRNVCYGYDVVLNPMYSAKVIDIDPSGGLVMQLDDGSTVTEYSGEIVYLD
ncbi:MAG: biotin--[acetyl-CoA-carboxylase] ligase [Desulfobulbaceae bacterium]|nr:biotin--[acetyl-CoA-carboxylase] ligase [Desulfobulbaceae bacterium]